MVSYKVYFYSLSIMFTLLNGQFIKSAELNELQTKNYINHLLESLFVPHNHPGTHQQHLHTFSQELTNDLIRNLGEYPHFYSFSKVYNDNQIYKQVVNESLSFIEKCARNCAIHEIQQFYTDVAGNQQLFVDKIVGLLMKELRTKINKSSILLEGIFSGYFGAGLTAKIQTLIDKQLKKEAARIDKLNARTKCPTCLFQFNTTTNKKITLNCSHNICLACLKSLYHQMGAMISCSKCNAKIDIRDYVQGAWVTTSHTGAYYHQNDSTYSCTGATYYYNPNLVN